LRLAAQETGRELPPVAAVDDAKSIGRHCIMKASATIFAVAALALVAASPANAKGCLKGAVVGGVAGHYAGHHGVLGAIAGCAYGRHRANEQDRQQDQQRQTQAPAGQEKL
jgi:outer membrane lipoprotein SlyB